MFVCVCVWYGVGMGGEGSGGDEMSFEFEFELSFWWGGLGKDASCSGDFDRSCAAGAAHRVRGEEERAPRLQERDRNVRGGP